MVRLQKFKVRRRCSVYLRPCHCPFGIVDVCRRGLRHHRRRGIARLIFPVWIWGGSPESGRALRRAEDLVGDSCATFKVTGLSMHFCQLLAATRSVVDGVVPTTIRLDLSARPRLRGGYRPARLNHRLCSLPRTRSAADAARTVDATSPARPEIDAAIAGSFPPSVQTPPADLTSRHAD